MKEDTKFVQLCNYIKEHPKITNKELKDTFDVSLPLITLARRNVKIPAPPKERYLSQLQPENLAFIEKLRKEHNLTYLQVIDSIITDARLEEEE